MVRGKTQLFREIYICEMCINLYFPEYLNIYIIVITVTIKYLYQILTTQTEGSQ